MALKYSLELRRNLSKGAAEGSLLYYGRVKYTHRVTFDNLCEQIADSSTATKGDVQVALNGLISQLKFHLANGAIVEMGELGNFRLNCGSTGANLAEEFRTTQFKRAKVIFAPGKVLRELCDAPKFERITEDDE